jgi:hypothetical protein
MDKRNFQGNLLFPDTRGIRNGKYATFHGANYDICKANFNILSICESFSGELKKYADGNVHKTWSGKPIKKGQ